MSSRTAVAVSRNRNQLDLFVVGSNGDTRTLAWTQGGDWTGLGNNWRDTGDVFPLGTP